jgi:hypothetical protein
MAPYGDGGQELERGGGTTIVLMRLALMATLVAATVAIASPSREGPPDQDRGGDACEPGRIALPPGHPPVGGWSRRPGAFGPLPPGHPPLDEPGFSAPFVRPDARPEPAFAPPGTVDI